MMLFLNNMDWSKMRLSVRHLTLAAQPHKAKGAVTFLVLPVSRVQ